MKSDVEYKSRSQQVRILSERWVAEVGYCLRCDSNALMATAANTRTRDFVCRVCEHGYELKSKEGHFSEKIVDGAYSSMIQTFESNRVPTFLLLEYSRPWTVNNLTAIHHSLISRTAIVPRNALSTTARRAGWVGCNILLPAIAIDGQIPLVRNGLILPAAESRKAFERLESLSKLSSDNRNWAATVLALVRRLNKSQFSLSELYIFELELKKLFPKNDHIRPKIRQQLQVLRDQGLVRFEGRGKYAI